MTTAGAHRWTNRLANETSPYLLQHAHNPVDWYPWGPEALARAQREDRPILLSIGYAACHWCHVMERESFEDETIAQLMNDSFVCIKVDREERPDLDEIYMAATVALSGSGGWPMTVFLTPDQRPFFAGTYFPPHDKWGRPGFSTVLGRLAELWQNDRARLEEQAHELTSHVRAQASAARALNVGDDAIRKAVRQLESQFDPEWGGFGSAPKFPPSAALSLLFRHHRKTGDSAALQMATATLNGMKNGGMYDQLAGGFARYSTDERWLVPHFEKMLYDNAELARVYLEGYQVTGDPEYRRVASETLDYIVREMQDPAGGYYSATDADSEGVEGKYFVWSRDELDTVLDREEAEWFAAYYDVTHEGNWEGTNVLNTPRPLQAVAVELGVSAGTLEQRLDEAKRKLYAARQARVPPLRDDKVLTSWNGLMISAMAEGHRVLRQRRYLESAERAAGYVTTTLRRPDGGLFRTARAGRAHLDAYLEDYAFLVNGLLDLYEAGGSSRWLRLAVELAERLQADFRDAESGAFFQTAHGHEALIVRSREGNDGAIPSANAAAARALCRLSYHQDRPELRDVAGRAIRAWGRLIDNTPRAFASSLAVVDLLLEGPVELALIGAPGADDTEALWGELARHYLPNRVIAHAGGSGETPGEPLLAGKTLVAGQAALYVCRNYACQAPITRAADVAALLGQHVQGTARSASIATPRLTGHATAKATAAYAERFADRYGEHGYAVLGNTGLVVSRIGFGGYRVDDATSRHREALVQALTSGCNLIDTSTNYTDGGSERLIGEVLEELSKAERLRREQIVVVSKIGYVQGKNLELARERERRGQPYPEMVKYGDELWHCLHPEWLADQLTRSLERLRLDTLDVCLLHNPEYFLSHAAKHARGSTVEARRAEFYGRLERAFAQLEREVANGRVRYYGVSSNTSTAAPDDPEATSLSAMLEAAERAGGAGHHFRVLQLPMNWLEPGAALVANTGAANAHTTLAQALTENVAVLVNRPLNAIAGRALLRLADVPELATEVDFSEQRAKVAELEREFAATLAPLLRTREGSEPPSSMFSWAEQLADMPLRLESREQWTEIEDYVIAPRVGQVCRALDQVLPGEIGARWRDFRDRYIPELGRLLESLRARAYARSRARAARLRSALEPHLPPEHRALPLSQLALWTLTSSPGVTTVLVGMRQPAYVDDALAVLRLPPLAAPERLLLAARDSGVVE